MTSTKPLIYCSDEVVDYSHQRRIGANREGMLKLRRLLDKALEREDCWGCRINVNDNWIIVYYKDDLEVIRGDQDEPT